MRQDDSSEEQPLGLGGYPGAHFGGVVAERRPWFGILAAPIMPSAAGRWRNGGLCPEQLALKLFVPVNYLPYVASLFRVPRWIETAFKPGNDHIAEL